MSVPKYLRVSPSGAVYVDMEAWVRSATRENNMRDASELVDWLKRGKKERCSE